MNDAMIEKAARMSLPVAIVVWLIGCGSSGTAVAPIEPTTPVSTITAPLPWVYAQVFSNASPLQTTVDALLANGAVKLPQSAMVSLWSQGVANQDLSPASWMFPVYVSSASDPVKSFNCTKWGACNANGMKIHVPLGALPEPQDDGHIGIIDTALGIEVDGWQCAVTANDVNCSWGGKYAFGGNAIENSGSNAVHGGYAAGMSVITAQELLNGQIDHALALTVTCLNNPTIYPADQNTSGSDKVCTDAAAPPYGALVHLLWSPSRIAASPYSAECKTILTALATYGAYTNDTGNAGLALLVQHQLSYTAIGKDSPWASTILPHLAASGDSSGTYWQSCLNRLSASDFELLQIKAGSY
jgi:hypothetical protein